MTAPDKLVAVPECPSPSRGGIRAARPTMDPAVFDKPAADGGREPGTPMSRRDAAQMFASVKAAMDLHSEIAKLNPQPPGWTLLRMVDGIEIDEKLLFLAWDPTNKALLDERVYTIALDLAQPTRAQRIKIWKLYNEAFQLRKTAEKMFTADTVEDRAAKRRLTTLDVGKQSRSFTLRELELVDTEAAFIAHVNVLKDRAGLGGRAVQKAMARRNPKITPAASTLAGWLTSSTLPPAGENVIRLLIEVILENIGDIADVSSVVAEHLRVWRSLIVERHAPGLVTSPVQLALQRLAALEESAPKGEGSRVAYRLALAEARQILLDALRDTRRALDPPTTASAAS